MTERKFNHQSWFLYYPEEGNTRGAPTQLLRGVEFGIETKALLFKRLCAYAGLHCEVYQKWITLVFADISTLIKTAMFCLIKLGHQRLQQIN